MRQICCGRGVSADMPPHAGDASSCKAVPDAGFVAADVPGRVAMLLETAEAAIAGWLRANGENPTDANIEGFRLLALHRQSARLDPRLNACRESCRELIYQCNMARACPAEAARRLRMAGMVRDHLLLFVAGKLENPALGAFCCAARPLRNADTNKGEQ